MECLSLFPLIPATVCRDSLSFTMSWNIPSSEVKHGWYLLKETQYWARYKTLRVSIQAIVAWKGLKKYTRCASMVSPAKKKLDCFNAFDLLNKLSFSRVEHSIPYTMWKTPTACNLVIMWSVLNKENRDNRTQEMLKEFCESTPRYSLHWRWKNYF